MRITNVVPMIWAVVPGQNLPDDDFVMADDYDWTLGQFVWTGFDYLGEPTPYGSEGWPNHSSMFGIFDLASLPKDRYYLYRSQWNHRSNTLHILPHWTWPGREGEITPIFVYTNYPEAELLSMVKVTVGGARAKQSPQHRYRLMWSDVVYRPGRDPECWLTTRRGLLWTKRAYVRQANLIGLNWRRIASICRGKREGFSLYYGASCRQTGKPLSYGRTVRALCRRRGWKISGGCQR